MGDFTLPKATFRARLAMMGRQGRGEWKEGSGAVFASGAAALLHIIISTEAVAPLPPNVP